MKFDNVVIRGYEGRKKPDPHIVYVVEVTTKNRVWTVFRRYSEFGDLHDLMAQKYGVRFNLPPKRAFGNMSPQVIETRRQGLEEFLKSLVLGRDERVANSPELSRFLETDAEESKAINNTIGTENWVEQFRALENLSNAITVHLTNRDRQIQRGENDGDEMLSARKKLIQLTTKLTELSAALKAAEADSSLPISEKELIRRHDMLDKLRADKEQMETWLKKPRVSESNTRELMGNGNGQAGGTGRARRVFGQDETEVTRNLDNQGLVQLQKQNIVQQDQTLDVLLNVLQKQKQIGLAISDELDTQLRELDDLDEAVDRTKDKLRRAGKKMATIS